MDVHCRPIAPKGCLRNPLGKEVEGRLEDKKFKPTASQIFVLFFRGGGRGYGGQHFRRDIVADLRPTPPARPN